MRKIKTLLIAAALFIGATSFTYAQTKVAHINSTELISSMPDMAKAKAEIDRLNKTYEADIKASISELQTKMKLYDSQAASQTDEENKKRVAEVQGMEQSIREYQAQAQQDMQKKEMEFLKPITEKAKAAILKVAKAQGFTYVLDSAQGGSVIMAEGKDLLADVKRELGF